MLPETTRSGEKKEPELREEVGKETPNPTVLRAQERFFFGYNDVVVVD